jgi:hypothetical protein
MLTRVQVRTAISAVIALVLAFSVVNILPGVSVVKASGATLVINEINWAGSTGHADDQWVELYNNTDAAVDISNDQLLVNDVPVVSFVTGAVQPHRFYLISRLASSPSLQVQPDLVAPMLILPATGAVYRLEDRGTHVPIDMAGNGSLLPLAGDDGMGNGHVVSSMARAFPILDGTLPASWYTSKTVGAGLKVGVLSYATPANASMVVPDMPNPILLPAAEVTITPSSPTMTGTATPVISGKASPAVSAVTIRFQKSGTPTFYEVSGPVTNGTFFLSLGAALDTGVYQAYSTTRDLIGDRSSTSLVALAGTTQGTYVVNPISSAVVHPPTLAPYPATVNVPTVTISGTSDLGTLVLSLNGKEYSSEQLLPGQTSFSLPVTLLSNMMNRIEVRAQDGSGHTSDPVVAEVTHDSLAPLPLVNTAVVVDANPVGTQNKLRGLVGAAEPNSTVEAYGDKALSNKIASASVLGDGSFAPVDVTNSSYPYVYVVARDAAGNMNPAYAIEIANPISFATSKPAVSIGLVSSTPDKLTVSWPALPGATNYRLKYKSVGGTYSVPMDLCSPGSACTLSRTLINLLPGTAYVVAVSPVDAFGNAGTYAETAFSTAPAAIGGPVNPIALPVSAPNSSVTPRQVQKSTYVPAPPIVTQPTVTPSATPLATATASASPTPASDQQGDVKSADTSRNYTPWIILAVLIGLAILATVGYFYWFGGEAGEEVIDSRPGAHDDSKPTPPSTKSVDEARMDEAKKDDVKPGSKEKRW